MGLNSSGIITMGSGSLGQSINLELGKSMTAYITMNDNDVRTLAGKVGINPISFSDFYGKPTTPSITPSKSATPPVTPTRTPSVTSTPAPTPTPSISLTPTQTPTPTPTPSPIPRYDHSAQQVFNCTNGSVVTIVTFSPLTNGNYYYSSDLGYCFVITSDAVENFTSIVNVTNYQIEACDSTTCGGGGGATVNCDCGSGCQSYLGTECPPGCVPC